MANGFKNKNKNTETKWKMKNKSVSKFFNEITTRTNENKNTIKQLILLDNPILFQTSTCFNHPN